MALLELPDGRLGAGVAEVFTRWASSAWDTPRASRASRRLIAKYSATGPSRSTGMATSAGRRPTRATAQPPSDPLRAPGRHDRPTRPAGPPGVGPLPVRLRRLRRSLSHRAGRPRARAHHHGHGHPRRPAPTHHHPGHWYDHRAQLRTRNRGPPRRRCRRHQHPRRQLLEHRRSPRHTPTRPTNGQRGRRDRSRQPRDESIHRPDNTPGSPDHQPPTNKLPICTTNSSTTTSTPDNAPVSSTSCSPRPHHGPARPPPDTAVGRHPTRAPANSRGSVDLTVFPA